MGVRNYLVEGVSGTGKTSVAEELERRGYQVIHGDRVLAYYGDPQTGAPLQYPAHLSEAERIAWGQPRWICPVDRVKALIADRTHEMTFFCRGSRNSHHFIDLFDQVFILDVDASTLNQRLARRGDDEFGGRPLERELVLRLHASKEDIPRSGTVIDATAPIGRVVDEILARCRDANDTAR